jgi:hypothetical protein
MANRRLTVTTISGVVISWSEPRQEGNVFDPYSDCRGDRWAGDRCGRIRICGQIEIWNVLIGIGIVTAIVLTIVHSFAP